MGKFESLEKYKMMQKEEVNKNNIIGGVLPTYNNKYSAEKTLVISNPDSGQGTVHTDNVWEGFTQD